MTAPNETVVEELEPEVAENGDDEVKTATGTLTLQAPEGAEFVHDEVKTARGTKSLGEVPILVWNNLEKARDHFGDEGILNILDGTSARVSYQAIARRFAAAGKTMDEIAQAQINFRPGKRAVGVSTPASRAGNAARRAAEKLGEKADSITKLMERIAKGEVSEEELAKLAGE